MKKQPPHPRPALPPVPVNERLNQESGKVLFPAKLKRAQEVLARVGLPTVWGEKATVVAKADAPAGSKVKSAVKPDNTQPQKAA